MPARSVALAPSRALAKAQALAILATLSYGDWTIARYKGGYGNGSTEETAMLAAGSRAIWPDRGKGVSRAPRRAARA